MHPSRGGDRSVRFRSAIGDAKAREPIPRRQPRSARTCTRARARARYSPMSEVRVFIAPCGRYLRSRPRARGIAETIAEAVFAFMSIQLRASVTNNRPLRAITKRNRAINKTHGTSLGKPLSDNASMRRDKGDTHPREMDARRQVIKQKAVNNCWTARGKHGAVQDRVGDDVGNLPEYCVPAASKTNERPGAKWKETDQPRDSSRRICGEHRAKLNYLLALCHWHLVF